jgi:hypothetical protein
MFLLSCPCGPFFHPNGSTFAMAISWLPSRVSKKERVKNNMYIEMVQ